MYRFVIKWGLVAGVGTVLYLTNNFLLLGLAGAGIVFNVWRKHKKKG